MYCYIASFEHPTLGALTKVGVSSQPRTRIRHIGSHYGFHGCKFDAVEIYNVPGRRGAIGLEQTLLALFFPSHGIAGEELLRCDPQKVVEAANKWMEWVCEGIV